MKIAVIYQHYFPEPFRLAEVCEELVKRGHEITVYTGLPNYPHGNIPNEYRWFKNRNQVINGVQVYRTWEIGRKPGAVGLALNYVSFMLSSSIKCLFAKKNFDIIFCYSTSPILMSVGGLILKKRSKKPLLMYVMDIWPACLAAMKIKENSLFYKFMTVVSKAIYKRCDKICYSSKNFSNYFKEVHNIDVLNEDYLPQFADSLFEQSAVNQYEQSNGYNFVFAGNIGHMQSVSTIVKAANILKQLPIKWCILGDGSEFENIKNLVKELNLEDNVILTGRLPVEEMPKYYSKASALLVTMQNDDLVNLTLPGKVQSYMAFGKAIIGSINGETQKLINEAKCGLCCDAEDYESLAKIVEQFISLDLSEKQTMAENSKAYYKNNFTKDTHINHLEKMLLNLGGKNV